MDQRILWYRTDIIVFSNVSSFISSWIQAGLNIIDVSRPICIGAPTLSNVFFYIHFWTTIAYELAYTLISARYHRFQQSLLFHIKSNPARPKHIWRVQSQLYQCTPKFRLFFSVPFFWTTIASELAYTSISDRYHRFQQSLLFHIKSNPARPKHIWRVQNHLYKRTPKFRMFFFLYPFLNDHSVWTSVYFDIRPISSSSAMSPLLYQVKSSPA